MIRLFSAPDWETDGRRWPLRERSEFVRAAGVRWHIQRLGDGPSLALIHGVGAATHSWAPIAPSLASKFSVLSFDLPGHGFTSALPRAATVGAVASSVAELFDAARFTPDYIVGHSAGAAVMVRYAADAAAPPRRLAGVNAALAPFDGAARFAFPFFAKMLSLNPAAAPFFSFAASNRRRIERLIEETGSSISAEGVDQYAMLLSHPGHVRGALSMMANWDLSGMKETLPRLNGEMLFIAGERDKAVPPSQAAEAASLARRGRAVTLKGVGHLAHEEDPVAAANEIIDFFVAH